MSVRTVRRSIAFTIAALVLGFAGTNTARADHEDGWGRRSYQAQSRQWRNDDCRRSWFRNDDCDRRNRYDSCRRDDFRRYDSRGGYSNGFSRRDRNRNRCR